MSRPPSAHFKACRHHPLPLTHAVVTVTSNMAVMAVMATGYKKAPGVAARGFGLKAVVYAALSLRLVRALALVSAGVGVTGKFVVSPSAFSSMRITSAKASRGGIVSAIC